MTKRIRIGGVRQSGAIRVDIPPLDVHLIDATALAVTAANDQLDELRDNWSQGRDAEGRAFGSLKDSTKRTREYDRNPPKPRKNGKAKRSGRYNARYPDGGVIDTNTPFHASGTLVSKTRVNLVSRGERNATANVAVPSERVAFVEAISRGRVPNTKRADPLGIASDALEDTTKQYVAEALSQRKPRGFTRRPGGEQ